MIKKVAYIFIFFIVFSSPSIAMSVAPPKKQISREAYSIKEIQTNPNILNRKVIVKGKFMGWKSNIGPPPITRSDWILKDETGEVYIVGYFPKGFSPTDDSDIGRKIVVQGIIKEIERFFFDKAIKIRYIEKKNG